MIVVVAILHIFFFFFSEFNCAELRRCFLATVTAFVVHSVHFDDSKLFRRHGGQRVFVFRSSSAACRTKSSVGFPNLDPIAR